MQRSLNVSRPTVGAADQVATDRDIDLGHELTCGFAARYICRKAKQIARRAGFSHSDIEDIQQQLIQRVLENFAAFDPEQGHFNAFVKTVVERHLANILRDARAAKRDHRQTRSLSTIVDEDESGPIELYETIGRDALDARLGTATRQPYEACDLALDLEEALAKLPPELRDLCERLNRASVSEVARELGVPRTTLYESIRKLRCHFEEIGLNSYL